MKSKIIIICIILYSCNNTQNNSSSSVDSTIYDTTNVSEIIKPSYKTIDSIGALNENDTAYLKTADGKTYLMTLEKDEENIPVTNDNRMPRASTSPGSIACQGEKFDGSDRKTAKTTISSATKENFAGLKDFLNDPNLKSDDDMGINHSPPISTSSTSTRVPEERRNIHIEQTWIYAFAREGDEDYHVIIGTTNNKNTAKFFNAEVSGLPATNSGTTFNKINKVRNDFKNHFGINSCHEGYYTFINEPVAVSITGSLFFDKHHFDGHQNTGTGIVKPKTFWEIHPITEIKFL